MYLIETDLLWNCYCDRDKETLSSDDVGEAVALERCLHCGTTPGNSHSFGSRGAAINLSEAMNPRKNGKLTTPLPPRNAGKLLCKVSVHHGTPTDLWRKRKG